MKIFKNFKENSNLERRLIDLGDMQNEAVMRIRKYNLLIKETGDAFQKLKSQCHYKDERIEELEQKIKIYEELILKGNFK